MLSAAGGITIAGTLLALLGWGRDGLETATWLAGPAGFLVAFATLIITLPGGNSNVNSGGDSVGDSRAGRVMRRPPVGEDFPIVQAAGRSIGARSASIVVAVMAVLACAIVALMTLGALFILTK